MNAQLCGAALACVTCSPLPIVDGHKIIALDAEGEQARCLPDKDLRCGIR